MVNRYMKTCSKLLVIRDTQDQTPMSTTSPRLERVSSRRQEINAGNGGQKKGPLGISGESVNQLRHYGNSMEVPSGLKVELLYDPAIPLWGMDPKEIKTEF